MNPTTSDFQPGPEFKAGFINLLGKPNAGKSSLLNALVGEPLSIVTPKAQTTRSRCLGMLQSETYQLIIGDTPGYLEARYALQRLMSRSIDLALEDADALVWVADMRDDPDQELFLPTLLPTSLPLILLLNQADLLDKEGRQTQKERWMNRFQGLPCLEVSCVTKEGVDAVKAWMLDVLPVHPRTLILINLRTSRTGSWPPNGSGSKYSCITTRKYPMHAMWLQNPSRKKRRLSALKQQFMWNEIPKKELSSAIKVLH